MAIKRTLFLMISVLLASAPVFSSSPYSEAAKCRPTSCESGDVMNEEPLKAKSAVSLRWRSVDPVLQEREEIAPDFEGTKIFIANFSESLDLGEIARHQGKELQFLEKIPVNSYLVKASKRGFMKLRNDDRYSRSFGLRPEDKVDPSLLEPGWESPVVIEAVLARGESPARLAEETKKSLFLGTLGTVENGLVLRWLCRPAELKSFATELAGFEEVILVEPFFLPRPSNDDSIWVIQNYDTVNRRNYPLSATIFAHGLLGEGEVAGISDTGLDNDMCYFAYNGAGYTAASYPELPSPGYLDPSKKVIGYSVLPGATAYDNNSACGGGFINFHGTHTTGSLAGDNFMNPAGTLDFGHDTGDGMAPMAKIFFQDAGDDLTGCMIGLANDYRDIFEQAFRAGVRIHSNSWGSGGGGSYTTECSIVDEYLYKNEDFSLFFAAGNSGPSPMTIDSPSSGKNCIAVGALIDGSAGSDAVADFSSRGPAKDGRVKPDIMAPGQNVTSADGTESSSDRNCGFKYMSGTSMATPTAAGGAVLLREYFVKGFYPGGEANAADSFSPSSSLIKASLVAGAMDVGKPDIPNESEGWGRVNLDRFAFFDSGERNDIRCAVYDVRNESGLTDGEEVTISTDMGKSGFLKVVLAWLDPEGSPMSSVPLVNDLDLEIVSPGGVLYHGNNFSQGVSYAGTSRDDINNVEGFFLPMAEAGTWQIKVKAADVHGTPREENSDRQGFALVVLKPAGPSPAAAPQDLDAVDVGPEGIRLSWSPVQGAASYSVYRIKNGAGSDPPASFIGMSATAAYSDLKAQGGYSYTYFVRASTGGFEGPASERATVTGSGECSIRPVFDGLKSALNDELTEECDIVLAWDPAVSQCPLSKEISYNVYRGNSPDFTPSAETLLVSGIKAVTFRDAAAPSYRTSYYIVRAEDGSSTGGGPSNGGNEDVNLTRVNATPLGPALDAGDWSDDGGDTFAFMSLEKPWKVDPSQNSTPSGSYCYAVAGAGEPYPPNTCGSITTPSIQLTGTSSALSYYVRYNLEYGWDGVIVEISEDGEDFVPVTPDQGYPGSFVNTGAYPMNRCQIPAEQGAFSGPQYSQELTPWARYSVGLSDHGGKTVRIRWRFSSDPAVEYDGFFLDDVKITGALLPGSCQGKDAVISFDRQRYGCDDSIFAELVDAAKKGTGKQAVHFSSGSEPSPESVELDEAPASSGHFEGAIATESSAAPANGKLYVKDGDEILASYQGENGIVERTAEADCAPPSIVSVSLVFISQNDLSVKISSDEAASAEIRYGKPGQADNVVKDGSVSENHSVRIEGLETCADYSYEIKMTDMAGNSNTSPMSNFKTKGCFPAPQVAVVKAAKDPFRLIVSGTGFMQDSVVKIDGAEAPSTAFRSSSKLVAKKGSKLKSMVPKGVAVQITVFNPSDMTSSEPFSYKR